MDTKDMNELNTDKEVVTDKLSQTEKSSPNSPGEKKIKKSDKESGKEEEGNKEREGFSNPFEFILTSLGLAVGLGNIWRFPTRAFENGGSAFLIPYLTCAFLFGLPAVYLEMISGQYQGVSPPIVFRRIMPILEGIGWMSSIVAAAVAVYYIVIISWLVIYIVNLFRGHLDIWNKCDNPWNNVTTCIDMLAQKECAIGNPNTAHLNPTSNTQFINLNGTCYDRSQFSNVTFVSATEQYLILNIIRKSDGLYDIGGMNYPVLIAMTCCWIVNGLVILRGMKIMGKISYVTTLMPYILIIILFFRGITLEGASTGLYYFFLNPDYSKLLSTSTWIAALKQLCFSLSVGHGGLMSMASYNKKTSNCFINAIIVIVGDTVMSLIGGAAVFSTLGFLANARNVTVPEVVESGLSLSFVVYPEAFTQMPAPLVWAFLFFFILVLLGISTEIALTEVFCTCIYDQSPRLRKRKWLVVSVWCFLLYLIGLVFSTNSGIYWFELFDDYAAGFSSVFTVTLEILAMMYFYGMKHVKMDIVSMIGPAKNICTGIFGAQSPYFLVNWLFISPMIGVVLIALSFIRDYPYNGDPVKYPILFDIVGWFIALIPIFMFPIFAIRNILWFRNNGFPLKGLFMLQKQHVSYQRITDLNGNASVKDEMLPDHEPWGDYGQMGLTPKEKSFYEQNNTNANTTLLLPYVSRADV